MPRKESQRRGFAKSPDALQILSHVDLLMFRKSWPLPEAPLADQAFVGFFSCVDSEVRHEQRRAGEAFPANRAGVRLLPSVDPPVHNEVGVLAEAFPAVGAGVRLLPSVGPHVVGESGAPVEALPALQALVRFLAQMDLLVLVEP